MPDVTEAVQEIRQQGFTIIRDLVTGERLEALREEASSLLVSWQAKSIDGGTIPGKMHKGTFFASRAFDDVITAPVLLAVVSGVLSEEGDYPHDRELNAYGESQKGNESGFKCNIMVKDVVPREDIRELHRDIRIPVPRPHRPVVCNSLLALEPFRVENGATCVIPRSHLLPGDNPPDQETVAVEMDAGSIVVFDGLIWHGHLPNQTYDRTRLCLNLNYHWRWIRQFPTERPDEWDSLPKSLQAVI